MTPTQRQAMEMALEAFKKINGVTLYGYPPVVSLTVDFHKEIAALRAALEEQADDKADTTIKLPAHHIPIGLLGADVRYRYIAHQYAEAYAREAVRLNMAPLSDEQFLAALKTIPDWRKVASCVPTPRDVKDAVEKAHGIKGG